MIVILIYSCPALLHSRSVADCWLPPPKSARKRLLESHGNMAPTCRTLMTVIISSEEPIDSEPRLTDTFLSFSPPFSRCSLLACGNFFRVARRLLFVFFLFRESEANLCTAGSQRHLSLCALLVTLHPAFLRNALASCRPRLTCIAGSAHSFCGVLSRFFLILSHYL